MPQDGTQTMNGEVDDHFIERLTFYAEWQIRARLGIYARGEPCLDGKSAADYVSDALCRELVEEKMLLETTSMNQSNREASDRRFKALCNKIHGTISNSSRRVRDKRPFDEAIETIDAVNSGDESNISIKIENDESLAQVVRRIEECPHWNDDPDCRKYLLYILRLANHQLDLAKPRYAHEALGIPIKELYRFRKRTRQCMHKCGECIGGTMDYFDMENHT